MRIVVFSHSGGSPYHGPNMRWYYLGAALLKRGHAVAIVSSSVFHKYFSPPTVTGPATDESIDGLAYRWLQTRPYRRRGVGQILNQLHYAWCVWREAARYTRGSVDIVIASSPHPLHVFGAWRAARRSGAAFVFEVRDLWPDALQQLAGVSRWHPYVLLLRLAEWFAVRRAEAIVSVKPGDWEHFARRYQVPRDRVHYLANGFLPIGASRLTSSDLKPNASTFLVGYVGALSAYYQLDTLLDVAERLVAQKNIRFCIVGGGDAEERLRARARDLGLVNVDFIGAVPKSRVADYLDLFDACYLGLQDVAVNEFGISCNKLFEYMEAAKPVVASYNTRYDPVAAAQCGITVRAGDANGVAAAILRLRDNRSEAMAMGARGHSYFSEHHDFAVIAAQFEALAVKTIQR